MSLKTDPKERAEWPKKANLLSQGGLVLGLHCPNPCLPVQA